MSTTVAPNPKGKSAAVRKSGEQLSLDIEEVQKSVNHLNGILLALVPSDHSVKVGDVATTRSQLRDQVHNIDKTLKAIRSQVRKGVRKGEPVKGAARKGNGGLDKPTFYNKELVDFFSTANLGLVDPTNPKSEKVADVVKRSVLGQKHIGTSTIFTRLFSILVRTNEFKDPERGQYIKFPSQFLEKKLPKLYKTLKDAEFDFGNITWIHLNKIAQCGVVDKTTLTDAQKEELVKYADGVKDLESITHQILDRIRDGEKAPVPTVPASLAADSASSTKKVSPKKAKAT